MIRHRAVQLEIFAGVSEEPPASRHAQRAEVHDLSRPGADHAARRRHAHELAAFQRLDCVAEDLRVAEAVLIAEHGDRLVPRRVDFAVLRITRSAAAWHGDRVHRLRQGGEQVVGRRAAAVVADIDDQAFLPHSRRVQVLLELLETFLAHRPHVQIAQSPAGSLFDRRAIFADPVRIEQRSHRGITRRPDAHPPLGAIGLSQREGHILAGRGTVKNPGEVGRRIDGRALDAEHHIAGHDPGAAPVGRPVRDHIAHLQARSDMAVVPAHAEVRGHRTPGVGRIGGRRTRRETEVRAVEFTQHQLDDGGELLGVG